MTRKIIIAKYREKPDPYGIFNGKNWWEICDVPYVIYNKLDTSNEGIHLPNIGREAHTYLYHIIHNYDKLADINIFTQADPHHPVGTPEDRKQTYTEYMNVFLHRIKYENFTDWTPLTDLITQLCYEGYDEIAENNNRSYDLHVNTFYKTFFNRTRNFSPAVPVPEYEFAIGAIFAVPKENIIMRPRSFYENALKMCLDSKYSLPNSGVHYYRKACGPWIMERLWKYLFDKSLLS